MSENTKVTQSQAQDAAQQASGQAVEYRLPPVNVYEDDSGIVLTADLPGVSSEQLNLEVDKDTLLIEGNASLDTPENMEVLYAEARGLRYRRSFALSNELDTAAIEANLKDGVLTVRLPKKATYQSRKIDVATA